MLLYPAERKMKAYQWCKQCHSYSRKGIVAKVQPIEYDARQQSLSRFRYRYTAEKCKAMCFRFAVVFSIPSIFANWILIFLKCDFKCQKIQMKSSFVNPTKVVFLYIIESFSIQENLQIWQLLC